MAKEAVFTMKLEPELRDAFMAAAEARRRPASQIVRELMRDSSRAGPDEYVEFLRRKVDEVAARHRCRARTHPSEEVEADIRCKRRGATSVRPRGDAA